MPIIDGSLFLESDRFFEVVLSNPSSGASLFDTQEKVLIGLAEDDPAPPMTVAAAGLSATSPGRLSVKEGDSGTTEVTFTVTQNQRRLPRTRNLNVQVVASRTTAAAGSDFAALDTNTTLEFAAGEASKTFTVTINGDTTAEKDETIGLSFLSGNGNFINSASVFFDVTITILDDDGTPSAPAAPALTAGNAQLSVQWSAPTDDGGVAITDYDVRHRPTTPSDSSWTELADTTASTATTATISSLTNGTVYEVQVRAQNENGAGGLVGFGRGDSLHHDPELYGGAHHPDGEHGHHDADGDHIRCHRHHRLHGESVPAGGVEFERQHRCHQRHTHRQERQSGDGDGPQRLRGALRPRPASSFPQWRANRWPRRW